MDGGRAGTERNVTLDEATARELDRVAKLTGKSRKALTRAALREYLEDCLDAAEIRRRMKRAGKSIPWPEVKQRLGLEG